MTALAAVVLLAVTGCSLHYQPRSGTGGQSNASAQAQLAAIPGVASATLTTTPWSSEGEGGFLSSSGMDIDVAIQVAGGHSIARPSQLVAFVLATAWSAQDKVPKGQVSVTVTGGVAPGFDWVQAARAGGVEPIENYSDDNASFSILGSAAAKLYDGVWPHTPVATPSGLISTAPLSPFAYRTDAVSSPFISRYQVSSDTVTTCFHVSLKRGVVDGITFTGPIREQWMNGGRIVQTSLVSSPENSKELCWPAKEAGHNGQYTLRVSAKDATGVFRSVTKTSNAD